MIKTIKELTHKNLRTRFIDMGLVGMDIYYNNETMERIPFDKIDNINLSEVKKINGLKWCGEFTIFQVD